MIIDLRSDAVSKPSKEMVQAMFSAEVGDDVFGDDPSVIELENYAAKLFNKEAALFCPSGIMCNQVAIKTQTPPGNNFLCNELAHIYYYENGGPAYLAGAIPQLAKHKNGIMEAESIHDHIKKNKNISLVCIENTVNKGGGCFYSFEHMSEISSICKSSGKKIHLDGARVFNALVETGDVPAETGNLFDTISFCLSKGLGAPAGSVLVGDKATMKEARAARNKFGGGMRQAGYYARAGLFALQNNVNRLKDDHARAKRIGKELEKMNFVEEVLPVHTNIIIFKLTSKYSNNSFLKKLEENNIKAVPFGEQTIRFVTHIDITDSMIDSLIHGLKQF